MKSMGGTMKKHATSVINMANVSQNPITNNSAELNFGSWLEKAERTNLSARSQYRNKDMVSVTNK